MYTIGHSTRSLDELIALLRHYGVSLLVDIRKIPRSRHNPQFHMEELSAQLPPAGIRYSHFPELGGLRKPVPNSPNTGWRTKGFQAFADYMLTEPFEAAIKIVIELAGEDQPALMCAEALYWRCHRMLVADALTARGIPVRHIENSTRADLHRLTSFARVEGTRILYPPDQPSLDLTSSPHQ